MKTGFLHFLVLILIGGGVPAYAAIGAKTPSPVAEKEAESRNVQEREERRRQRMDRLRNRLEDKLRRKMDKRKEKMAPEVWDNSRFRLGAILVLASLGLGLVGALLGVGFFGFLAGGLALAGIILIIWSLIEYYN